MKKAILPILLIVAFFQQACKKDDTPPNENIYASFRSYFSCYINGEYFEPKGIFGCHKMYVSYYKEDYYNIGSGGGELRVSGRNCLAEIGEYWSVGIVKYSVFEPETINLATDFRYHNVFVRGGWDSINNTDYQFNNTVSGKLVIDKLVPHVTGESNGVVIGTFEFTVHNNQGDTARVTNGKFGMKLPNP